MEDSSPRPDTARIAKDAFLSARIRSEWRDKKGLDVRSVRFDPDGTVEIHTTDWSAGGVEASSSMTRDELSAMGLVV